MGKCENDEELYHFIADCIVVPVNYVREYKYWSCISFYGQLAVFMFVKLSTVLNLRTWAAFRLS